MIVGLPLSVRAEEASADEIARELANPNTALASLTLKNQYRFYEGDLPGADDQHGFTLLFQPSLPFPLANGDTLLFRPAIPFQFDQPVFDPDSFSFDGKYGLGDVAFDLAYARTAKSGLLTAAGIVSTLPTATNPALRSNRWLFGPELLIGYLQPKYVLGIFPNHQWKIAGGGETASLTTIQTFTTYLPGGGWSVGSAPIMTYDWKASQWTIPINLNVSKTTSIGRQPVKLGLALNYFVARPDAFGPEWMIEFTITPVVKNVLAELF